jgi:CSLREA domain-containing protein
MMRLASLYSRLLLALALTLLVALAFASPSVTSAGGGYVVSKTADTADGDCGVDCSLREAIIESNAVGGTDVITLPEGTYTLTIEDPLEENLAAMGDLDITSEIVINGEGADDTIIDGGGLSRLFHILAPAVATISGVTLQNGHAGHGGAIYIASGSLALDNTAIRDNDTKTSGGGGGIFNQATLTITNSTISGNTATGASGGGIYTFSIGTTTVTNSTVSGNAALFGGGGLFSGSTSTTNLELVTIANNTATTPNSGSGIRKEGDFGAVNLKNTIVANGGEGGNCFGTITSNGNNLDSGTTCGLGGGDGNISNADPLLSPLALNAPGTTETHALSPSSPAFDAGSSDCRPPTTDQRGVLRPLGEACDIGAYELDPRGDTNCDGLVDGDDAVPVLVEVADFPPEVDCLENGDVDRDGEFTTTDALLILEYATGIITVFPNSGD